MTAAKDLQDVEGIDPRDTRTGAAEHASTPPPRRQTKEVMP
jgi:hypothetical protein